MVALTGLVAALGALVFLFTCDAVVATPGFRKSASPGYSSANVCPERCSISGPNTSNWSVYRDFNKIKRCPETMFYDFFLYDEVDSMTGNHRIQACSSFGPDFSIIPPSTMQIAATEPRNVEFQIGWWNEGFGLAASGIRSLVKQLRKYADHGHGATDNPFIIYGQSGQATIGLYIGPGLLNQGVSLSALKLFEDNFERLNLSTPALAMELCGPEYGSSHTFSLMATSNGTFSSIQRAVRSWAKGRCLSFSGSTKFPGNVNSTLHIRSLHPRAQCRTIQVKENDLCPGLATRCGILITNFNKYNPSGDIFCNNLKVKQHVYYSSRDLPDLRLKPNKDSSYHAYQAQGDNNCNSLAANKGTPLFPAPITNAVLDITKLNPCPLNACPPGTTTPNTYGCISNCGLDVVKGSGTDTLQINTSKYTHIHFGFGTLTPDYQVKEFLNSDATYKIFRTRVHPENQHNLNTPDLPEYDPSTAEEGPNYFTFLIILKNLLPSRSFPIKQMSMILNYIIYMTYNLHGYQVNLTEIKQSLVIITKAGVPGEKVIMADPGDCLNSNAKQGKFIKSFVDTTSNSDILVYNNDEWVGYMSSATKKARTTLYSAWGLGGTSDWATDLQDYHPVPKPAASWGTFIRLATSGQNPKVDYTRNGKWTDLNCSHEVIIGKWGYSPSDRWKAVKADEAWEDVVRIWLETDRPNNVVTIVDSLSSTLQLGDQANCGRNTDDSCETLDCIDHKEPERAKLTGPAAQFIWNSIAEIHKKFVDYHTKLWEAATALNSAMDDLQNKFAPLPEKDEDVWKDLLFDLLTLGGIGSAGSLFSKALSQHAWFRQADSRVEDTTAVAQTLLGQGISIVRELNGGDDPSWTPEKQDEFSAYMGQVITAWSDINSIALGHLLTAREQEQIDAIWKLISDGKLIEGSSDKPAPDIGDQEIELRENILKCVFGFTIPALWRAAGTRAFIIDTESQCGPSDTHYLKDMEQYLDKGTMNTRGECIDGRQFYLVYPEGDAKECECVHKPTGGACEWYCRDNTFSSPTGLDTLNGANFENITKSDLVLGSVNTWKANSKQNTDKYPDATSAETVRRLINVDITTPGFMQIPICSAEHAFKSWDSSKPESSAFYPCKIPENQNHCGLSTFEDQTSEASPWVEDCLTIIRNIQWDGNTQWTTQVVGKPHREVAQHGSCHFGVEATSVSGNVDFLVGGEDVISIIRDSIAKFAKDNKQIGARGYMNCNGNIKAQPVLWGIY
ncbi:hypothetical protein BJX64DRAFT_275079 [Aspergillus heterothallicus]